METKTKIRRLHFVQGLSIKELVKKTGLSRNTIRKILRAETADQEYVRSTQVKPKLDAYTETLEAWLIEDSKLPRKERRTASRYYSLLEKEGYTGAYDSVQRYVKLWKQEHRQNKSAYIPLTFDPAEAYQFDWSDEKVELDGCCLYIM